MGGKETEEDQRIKLSEELRAEAHGSQPECKAQGPKTESNCWIKGQQK